MEQSICDGNILAQMYIALWLLHVAAGSSMAGPERRPAKQQQAACSPEHIQPLVQEDAVCTDPG